MGLLRRAAVAAGSAAVATGAPALQGPGLLGRSIKALEPSPEEAGEPGPSETPLTIELAAERLDVPAPVRVEAAETHDAPAPPVPAPDSSSRARTFEDTLEGVRSAIAGLPAGVELPSRLFTALTALLGIRKAALLLYDPVRLVYAPWALRGYDQTTLHRIRIPLGANEAWNALANGAPVLLSGTQQLAGFQQYFSAREFSSISRLVLVPFIAEEKLVAVLLITEIESLFAGDDELLECLSRAARQGAPRVQEARAARIESAGSGVPPTDTAAVRDEIGQFVTSLASRESGLLVLLSVEEFARKVLSVHEHLDPFRLHEDVSFFLGSFLSDVGKCLPVRTGRFVLALPDFRGSSLELFSHQLSLFLRGLFGDGEGVETTIHPRILKTAAWPADGEDLRALVESLSS